MLDFILKTKTHKLFSFNYLKKKCPVSTIFPFYHTVSNEPLPYTQNLYTVKSIKDFKYDLEFLLKHYEPISPADLLKMNGNSTSRYMLLSFDDGLKECHEIIMPLLKELKIPAIFFVNTAFIDNKRMFYRFKASLLIQELNKPNIKSEKKEKIRAILLKNGYKQKKISDSIMSIPYFDKELLNIFADILHFDFKNFLVRSKPYLTSPQVNDLIKNGFFIGSHSVDHPAFMDVNFYDQVSQVSESMRMLKTNFGINERYFSFPFTDYGITTNLLKRMHESSDINLELSFGTAGLKNDTYRGHYQRIPMEVQNFGAKEIMKSEYIYFAIKALFGKNKIKRH